MSNIITTFQIANVTCDACKKIIEKRLGKIEGVSEVFVDITTGATNVKAVRNINLLEIKTALEGTHYLPN